MKKIIILISILLIAINTTDAQNQVWYKGNTHMHTDFSDGDSPIKEVVDWYHDNGYNFISITDHNLTTVPLDHISRDGLRDDFIMIIGNEITSSVHFTALGVKNNFSAKSIVADYEAGNLTGYDLPGPDTSKVGHSQILINGMLREGALVFINHPNFSTGISAEEMALLRGTLAIELSNAHPSVYNSGNERHIPVEEKWDYLLSKGMRIFAVGSDDEHNIQKWGPDAANPGRSWIMVEADELTEKNILGSILLGKFYTSTGVELSQYKVNADKISLVIDEKQTLRNLKKGLGSPYISDKGTEGFNVEVISYGGKVIESMPGLNIDYQFPRINKYLRVRASYCIKEGDAYKTYFAWMQPLFFR